MNEVAPKADFKFFISWIVCSLSMFGLSYLWHAVVLNDFLKISYPIDVFLTVAAIVYLGIGLFITILTYIGKQIKNSFKYGILIGVFAGVFIYALAFIFGISFYTVVDVKMIAFDLGWQSFEQGFGGLVCGWVYRSLYMRSKMLARAN